MRFLISKVIIFLIILFISSKSYSNNFDWYYSNGTELGEKYSNISQINTKNVSNLEVEWIYDGKETLTTNSNQTTPIFTGNSVVISSNNGYLISLNPLNGIEQWKVKLPTPVARRGVTYNSDLSTIFVPTGNGVYAIDPNNGKIRSEFGIDGVFGNDKSLLSPIIIGNKDLVVANLTSVKSYSLNKGKINWETRIKTGSISPRIWSGFSYDPLNNIFFIVTSNPGGIVGIDRDYKNKDFSCSLVAIDGKSGEILWSFQEVIDDLWDFDLVGSPIIFEYKKNKTAVIALTKTGNLIYLDTLTGQEIFTNSIEYIKTPTSEIKEVKNSNYQIKILKPNQFSNTEVDPEKDLNILDEETKQFLDHKLRYAKYGLFPTPSVNEDVIIKGIHGGAEWPGATLYKKKNILVIPSNNTPWILRLDYKDKRLDFIFKVLRRLNLFKDGEKPRWDKNKLITDSASSSNVERIYSFFVKGNNVYDQKCSACHGISRTGIYQNETIGDHFIPSLVGISMKKKFEQLDSLENFYKAHSFIENEVIPLTQKELKSLNKYFKDIDSFAKRFNLLTYTGGWQILLDQNDMPAIKPPWGYLTAIDMESGETIWKIPNGTSFDEKRNLKIDGSINFGGVLSTSGDLVFSTGTTDNFIRAYNVLNGERLWEYQLNYAGSAPPMTYFYNDCQYIIVNASGGRFVGYDKTASNLTVAFKLNNCQ